MRNFFGKNGEIVGRMYLGDCLEVIPTITDPIEIAITSPPYNLLSGISKINKTNLVKKGWYEDSKLESDYQEEQKRVIEKLLDLCSSSIFYNHKVRYAWHPRNNKQVGPSRIYHPIHWLSDFPIWMETIWDRNTKSPPVQKKFSAQDERIYMLQKPAKWFDFGWSNIWKIFPSRNKDHVCSFPAGIVDRCMLSTSDIGDWIIDPYMGSGTTAIQAIKHGRRFIGIEKNKIFFDLACEKIQIELSKNQQLKLF